MAPVKSAVTATIGSDFTAIFVKVAPQLGLIDARRKEARNDLPEQNAHAARGGRDKEEVLPHAFRECLELRGPRRGARTRLLNGRRGCSHGQRLAELRKKVLEQRKDGEIERQDSDGDQAAESEPEKASPRSPEMNRKHKGQTPRPLRGAWSQAKPARAIQA